MTADPKTIIEDQYRSYVSRFKRLHVAQAILIKIGHIPAGTAPIETKIFASLKKLKSTIDTASPLVLNAQLTAVDSLLKEYEEWLSQNNNTVTPFGLRQYISQQILKHEELIDYARYLSTQQQNTPDERGKLELVLSELCKKMGREEREMLLLELFPDSALSPVAMQVLEHIKLLTRRVESYEDLPEFINSDCMSLARKLKMDLGQSLWNPESIAIISTLNLKMEQSFHRLFTAERNFILESCRRLKNSGVNYIAKSGETGVLNIDQAARLAEKSDGLLEQNYNTNLQKLQQISKVGHWLRQALRVLEPHPATTAELKNLAVERPKAERDSTLDPISTNLDYANYSAMEAQLTKRIEELKAILEQRPRLSGMEVIQLKKTVLLLAEWETASIMSMGELVIKSKKLPYDIIRRGLGLVAELQETTAILAEDTERDMQKVLSALSYFLDQSRHVQGELETISQSCRQSGEIEMALNLHGTRSKLQECSQRTIQFLRSLGHDFE